MKALDTNAEISRGSRSPLRRSPLARSFAVGLFALVLALICYPAFAWAEDQKVIPVSGQIVAAYDPPDQPWLAGHRGVDLAAAPGDRIRAAATGRVTHVGVIAGIGTVSITHSDGLRTTYQPIDATVSMGQTVVVGQVIGTLSASGSHCQAGCLHWGLRDGDDYRDPLAWLGKSALSGDIRLLPSDAQVKPSPAHDWVDELNQAGANADSVASGPAGMPADGPVTSPFSHRINPIRGTPELHDGLDIGASCGTPVRAAWSGTVRYAAVMSGFGNRIEIDHGVVDGQTLASSYNHLSDEGVGMVSLGQHVEAGQVIALVGTTGLSTGCHLHFSVYQAGTAVDPMPFLDS